MQVGGGVLAGCLAMVSLAVACTASSGPPDARLTTRASEASTATPSSKEDPGGPIVDAGELTVVLNQDLVALIKQAAYEPLGGDHDFMNASQIVESSGERVSIFVYPIDRADLGDVRFQPQATQTVGDIAVVLGRRSDGAPTARFNCGSYQFQFFGPAADPVSQVARDLAAVASCPYVPEVTEPSSLSDGPLPAFLREIDVDQHTLTVDVVQWLTGADADEAYRADNPGETGGAPNDYYIVNDNPRLRTLHVADDVEVLLVRLHEDADPDLDSGTWEQLSTYLAEYETDDQRLSFNPFWITIDNDVVVRIEEQYVP